MNPNKCKRTNAGSIPFKARLRQYVIVTIFGSLQLMALGLIRQVGRINLNDEPASVIALYSSCNASAKSFNKASSSPL